MPSLICSLLLLASLWFAGSVRVLAEGVDLNTADAVTLARDMKGIGEVRARAIVEYRTQHGPFKSIDELALVKGIGQKVIDQNRDLVVLAPPPAEKSAGQKNTRQRNAIDRSAPGAPRAATGTTKPSQQAAPAASGKSPSR